MKTPRSIAKFTQADVTRALKGATKAGLPVAGYKISLDGSIEIKVGTPDNDNDVGKTGNPWDTI